MVTEGALGVTNSDPHTSGRARSTRGVTSGDDRLTQGECDSLWVTLGDAGKSIETQCGSVRRNMVWLVVASWWLALASELQRLP